MGRVFVRGRRMLIAGGLVAVALLAACSSGTSTSTGFSGFDGCKAGAQSVVAFLQRTLDQVGAAEPDELAPFVTEFDEGVNALLLRAQEVHCTEEGFNNAIVDVVGELEGQGSAGEQLIESVRERGLGSLEESSGGPIRLPVG